MFADCEACYNCVETEDGYYCERYGTDINCVQDCEEWQESEETLWS